MKSTTFWLRLVLLILGLLLSPLWCSSCAILAEGIPPEYLPESADFVLHMWEARVRVANHTHETLYLTPITTALGTPEAIPQWLRGRDIPLRAGRQITIPYNVEFGLDGFVVCPREGDCRWLEAASWLKRGAPEKESSGSLPSPACPLCRPTGWRQPRPSPVSTSLPGSRSSPEGFQGSAFGGGRPWADTPPPRLLKTQPPRRAWARRG